MAKGCLLDKAAERCFLDKAAEGCLFDRVTEGCLFDRATEGCLLDSTTERCLLDKVGKDLPIIRPRMSSPWYSPQARPTRWYDSIIRNSWKGVQEPPHHAHEPVVEGSESREWLQAVLLGWLADYQHQEPLLWPQYGNPVVRWLAPSPFPDVVSGSLQISCCQLLLLSSSPKSSGATFGFPQWLPVVFCCSHCVLHRKSQQLLMLHLCSFFYFCRF